MRVPLIGLTLFCALTYAQASMAQPRDPEEPGTDVISSGKCEVPVCTDIDFGDHFFRYYAPGRAIRLKFIPKGSCKCTTIRSGNKDFNGSIVTAVTTSDTKVFPNVSVVRVQKGDGSKAADWTSWERFQQIQQELVEFPDLKWSDDNFSNFKILVHPRIHPSNRRLLYFVSQRQFRFRGQTQPIVFDTALGYRIGNKEDERDGPRVVARVRLTSSVHLFEFFVPRLTRSSEWITSIENVAEAVDARLFPKSD